LPAQEKAVVERRVTRSAARSGVSRRGSATPEGNERQRRQRRRHVLEDGVSGEVGGEEVIYGDMAASTNQLMAVAVRARRVNQRLLLRRFTTPKDAGRFAQS